MVAREKAKLEQDLWLKAIMRQMITEVQRQVSMVYSLVTAAAQSNASVGKGPDG